MSAHRSRTLAPLRDALLPKLRSWKLSVSRGTDRGEVTV
jgi:hypothetical protein